MDAQASGAGASVERDATYWDSLAHEYDGFYCGEWSRKEDERTQREIVDLIGTIPAKRSLRVLDLGCGTGLGLKMLSGLERPFHYHGVDISRSMLEVARVNAERIAEPPDRSYSFVQDDLAVYDIGDDEYDVVISINSSLSFLPPTSLASLLAKASDALFPGGVLLVQMLNRSSLRRVLRRETSAAAAYRTRSSHSTAGNALAHYTTANDLETALTSIRMTAISISGDGPLTGLLEWSPLFGVNSFLGRRSTTLSHSVIAVGRKQCDRS